MQLTFKQLLFLLMASTILGLSACKKDKDDPNDPNNHNDEELITTVSIDIIDPISGSRDTYRWSDADGAGGNDPVIDEIILSSDLTYAVEISFLDESGDQVVDITAEIKEEDDEHIVCFAIDGDLTISATDTDGTYALGLDSDWAVGATGTGTITISLKHQPGTKDGTCAPGETDVEVTFPFESI